MLQPLTKLRDKQGRWRECEMREGVCGEDPVGCSHFYLKPVPSPGLSSLSSACVPSAIPCPLTGEWREPVSWIFCSTDLPPSDLRWQVVSHRWPWWVPGKPAPCLGLAFLFPVFPVTCGFLVELGANQSQVRSLWGMLSGVCDNHFNRLLCWRKRIHQGTWGHQGLQPVVSVTAKHWFL